MTPSQSPHPVAIPSAFQPPANDDGTQTVLEWRIFAPATGGPKWPVVVILHVGGFKTGGLFSNTMLESEQDLVAAGYYVFVADYRLAPCGLIKGQTCHITDESSGRPPQQTNDVKAIMRAARADTHCNGFVGIVGGSAGGSHAAFVNLDRSVSADWPFWNNYRDDRPDAVVLLSGAYDFSDRTTEGYMPDPVKPFKDFIENYTNSCDLNYERSKSPVSLLSPSTADIKPMFLINSEMDTMPFHQIVDMENALQAAGVDSSLYKVLTVPDSSSHAFEYWREWDGIPPVGSEPEHDVPITPFNSWTNTLSHSSFGEIKKRRL